MSAAAFSPPRSLAIGLGPLPWVEKGLEKLTCRASRRAARCGWLSLWSPKRGARAMIKNCCWARSGLGDYAMKTRVEAENGCFREDNHLGRVPLEALGGY